MGRGRAHRGQFSRRAPPRGPPPQSWQTAVASCIVVQHVPGTAVRLTSAVPAVKQVTVPSVGFVSTPQQSTRLRQTTRTTDKERGPSLRMTIQTKTFIWARPQVLGYCVAQCLLYAGLGVSFPAVFDASVIVIVGHLVLLASRTGLAQLADQHRARELFSVCWAAVYALVNGSVWLVNWRSPVLADLPAEAMHGIFVLLLVEAVYMRVLSVHTWARLAAAACDAILFAALPAPWSELGQPYEALGVLGARLAGELFIKISIWSGGGRLPTDVKKAV